MALSNECHFFCQNLRAREEKGVFKGEIVPLKVCYLIARKGVTVPTEGGAPNHPIGLGAYSVVGRDDPRGGANCDDRFVVQTEDQK